MGEVAFSDVEVVNELLQTGGAPVGAMTTEEMKRWRKLFIFPECCQTLLMTNPIM